MDINFSKKIFGSNTSDSVNKTGKKQKAVTKPSAIIFNEATGPSGEQVNCDYAPPTSAQPAAKPLAKNTSNNLNSILETTDKELVQQRHTSSGKNVWYNQALTEVLSNLYVNGQDCATLIKKGNTNFSISRGVLDRQQKKYQDEFNKREKEFEIEKSIALETGDNARLQEAYAEYRKAQERLFCIELMKKASDSIGDVAHEHNLNGKLFTLNDNKGQISFDNFANEFGKNYLKEVQDGKNTDTLAILDRLGKTCDVKIRPGWWDSYEVRDKDTPIKQFAHQDFEVARATYNYENVKIVLGNSGKHFLLPVKIKMKKRVNCKKY